MKVTSPFLTFFLPALGPSAWIERVLAPLLPACGAFHLSLPMAAAFETVSASRSDPPGGFVRSGSLTTPSSFARRSIANLPALSSEALFAAEARPTAVLRPLQPPHLSPRGLASTYRAASADSVLLLDKAHGKFGLANGVRCAR